MPHAVQRFVLTALDVFIIPPFLLFNNKV